MLNLFLWVQFYKTRNFTDSGNTSISYFSHNRFLKSEKDWTEAEIPSIALCKVAGIHWC